MTNKTHAIQSNIIIIDDLEDDLLDYPQNEAAEETYIDNTYARASAYLSDNLKC